jgi:hypothetical protein
MFEIEKLPSDIFGLKYIPQIIEDEVTGPDPNNRDCLEITVFHPYHTQGKNVRQEFSSQNHAILISEIERLGDDCQCVLEIGVNRFSDVSSTRTILNRKPNHCIYIGVDIDDKSDLDSVDECVYTIKSSSENMHLVEELLRKFDVEKFDLIHIDGWHSVNGVINDWKYVKYLSDWGTVLLHDTSVFPGPFVVYDAVDENLFDKTKYFEFDYSDWGISVCRRK